MPHLSAADSHKPAEVARLVHTVGVTKATMPTAQILMLAMLGGAFIAFGAMYYTVVATDAGAAYGPAKMLGGIAFSLGFILVTVAGAELFTGNNLIAMAWAAGEINGRQLLRNWILVYFANMVGAFGSVALIHLSGYLHGHHHMVGATAVKIALAKVDIGLLQAFVKGILCNALVCLASWMCYAGRTVADRVLAIVFPVSAFVAMGFEHSIANMFMIPVGIIAAADPQILEAGGITADKLGNLHLAGFLRNLLPVTLGNIVGGAIMVALVYKFIYLRGRGEGL